MPQINDSPNAVYSALRVSNFAGATLGYTGPQKFDGTEAFAIGLWVRIPSINAEGCLLTRSSAFTLLVAEDALLSFGFGENQTVNSLWGLTPDVWHHVMIEYGPQQNNTGLLTFTIDGSPADTTPGGAVIEYGSELDTGQPITLGAGEGAPLSCDVLAATFYSQAAVTEDTSGGAWAAPSPDTPGLLAAFDFACGTPKDLSTNNYPVTITAPAEIAFFMPAASFEGSGEYAQPNADETINFANGAEPFTILILGYPATGVGQAGGGPIISNRCQTGPGAFTFSATSTVEGEATTSQGSLTFTPASGPSVTRSIPAAMSSETVITFDGTNLSTYYNGELVDTTPCGPLAPIAQPQPMIGAAYASGSTSPTVLSGYVQRVAIWAVCLTAAEVGGLQDTSPLADPECVFYTEFLDANPCNRVTAYPLVLNGGLQVAELVYSPDAASQAAALPPLKTTSAAGPQDGAAPSASARAAMVKAADALAANAPQADLGQTRTAVLSELEPLLSPLPAAHQGTIRALAQSNLDRVAKLQAAGAQLPGQVSWATEGSDVVFRYQDPSEGLIEIGRAPTAKIDPKTAWCVSFLIQCVVCVCDMLLIRYVAKGLSDAACAAISAAPTIREAIELTRSTPLTGMTFINILKSVYQAGALGQILMTIISSKSWWSWAFTIASAVLSICAIWLSGGAYLAVVIAQLALDIPKLVIIIREAPDDLTYEVEAPVGAAT